MVVPFNRALPFNAKPTLPLISYQPYCLVCDTPPACVTFAALPFYYLPNMNLQQRHMPATHTPLPTTCLPQLYQPFTSIPCLLALLPCWCFGRHNHYDDNSGA